MMIHEQKPKQRLYTIENLVAESTVSLTANQTHYLKNVMRYEVGDVVALFNGKDGEWLAELTLLSKRGAVATCLGQIKPQPSDKTSPWLVFSTIKKNRLDFLVEKATELGAVALMPVVTQHCQNPRLKLERIEAQVIEAAEQCERLEVPSVSPEQSLKKLLQNWPTDRVLLVCVERDGAQNLLELSKDWQSQEAGILIGPEGGFSKDELALFDSYPFIQKITLGERILRAETAVCAALSLFDTLLHK